MVKHPMLARHPYIVNLLVVVATIALFGVGAHFGMRSLIAQTQIKQLKDLAETALRRVEATVDDGAATLTALAKRKDLSCDPARLQALRLQVYQRPGIKDIRLVKHDGTINCSAYPETLEFDTSRIDRSDMLPATDKRLLVFRVDQIEGEAFGILIDKDDETSIEVIMGVTPSLLDIMPAELRSVSDVSLMLASGMAIERFAPQSDKPLNDNLRFSFESAMYPVSLVVRVHRDAFNNWDAEGYLPGLMGAMGFGLIFGVLLAKAVAKGRGDLAELDRALKRKEFRPYYQPTFDLATKQIIGCEILTRWVKPDGKIVPPLKFIPLAEETGRIQELTWQVLGTALKELNARMRRDKTFRLSVNVVPAHLLRNDFVTSLRETAKRAKISPRQIVIEVTERQQFQDVTRAKSVIQELQKYGFKIALDDVGIGHSGLSQIKTLGVDVIKIDKFFIDTITTDQSAITIVEMMQRLAKQLDMSVIAEGIESEDQVATLLNCGVSLGQGYLVAPPLPAEEFEKICQRSGAEVLKKDRSLAYVA